MQIVKQFCGRWGMDGGGRVDRGNRMSSNSVALLIIEHLLLLSTVIPCRNAIPVVYNEASAPEAVLPASNNDDTSPAPALVLPSLPGETLYSPVPGLICSTPLLASSCSQHCSGMLALTSPAPLALRLLATTNNEFVVRPATPSQTVNTFEVPGNPLSMQNRHEPRHKLFKVPSSKPRIKVCSAFKEGGSGIPYIQFTQSAAKISDTVIDDLAANTVSMSQFASRLTNACFYDRDLVGKNWTGRSSDGKYDPGKALSPRRRHAIFSAAYSKHPPSNPNKLKEFECSIATAVNTYLRSRKMRRKVFD